jgi:excisionase family DNA binding protein
MPRTIRSAKSYDVASEKYARSHECFDLKIQSGILGNIREQWDARMSRTTSIVLEAPLVASPNQAMRMIQVSRKKLYELINTGELESYTEGKSRRITVKSINDYIERRLAAEAIRRGRAASYGDDQSH